MERKPLDHSHQIQTAAGDRAVAKKKRHRSGYVSRSNFEEIGQGSSKGKRNLSALAHSKYHDGIACENAVHLLEESRRGDVFEVIII